MKKIISCAMIGLLTAHLPIVVSASRRDGGGDLLRQEAKNTPRSMRQNIFSAFDTPDFDTFIV